MRKVIVTKVTLQTLVVTSVEEDEPLTDEQLLESVRTMDLHFRTHSMSCHYSVVKDN